MLFALACIMPGVQTAFAADLTITIEGVRNTKGVVSFSLYGAGDPWPDGEAPLHADLPAAPTLHYVFKDLPPGRYALTGFHDENANGLFDSNFLGLPKEGFLFSQDTKPRLSSPSFESCAIMMADQPVAITVHMQYWRSTQ